MEHTRQDWLILMRLQRDTEYVVASYALVDLKHAVLVLHSQHQLLVVVSVVRESHRRHLNRARDVLRVARILVRQVHARLSAARVVQLNNTIFTSPLTRTARPASTSLT